jgi:hypothetical protein
MTVFPKSSPPNVLIGGPVRISPVVSPSNYRLKHAGMTVFGKEIILEQQAAGELDP